MHMVLLATAALDADEARSVVTLWLKAWKPLGNGHRDYFVRRFEVK